MEKLKEKLKSVRVKLFLTLCVVIVVIIVCLILINSAVLETFYMYSKVRTIKDVYHKINDYYNHPNSEIDIDTELKNVALKNNFDILIETEQNILLFTTDKDFITSIGQKQIINILDQSKERENILYMEKNMNIRKIINKENNLHYILLSGTLDNGYLLYIRIPVSAIQESVKISNNLLILIGGVAILLSAIVASFVSKKFTEPITELSDIANKMSRLDFSQKYRISDTDDEINNLGKSINTMSDKLEITIKQLRDTNIELEKDIEEKSKIDEMRKQFISDVSHELKTPIALIQGYAEGLIENVNRDEESRKFYAEVILDESNKMDRLVKQLLELMKLEYGKREFQNERFNLVELITEVIRKCDVMLQENHIQIQMENVEPVYVIADDFYIEQVITNYITNAIKHAKKEKIIRISIQKMEKTVRVKVFNTGDHIPEEDLEKIWGRFYKIDISRNREQSGSGIGLALVRAIMNNYQRDYGVINKENGVEFYFDLDIG